MKHKQSARDAGHPTRLFKLAQLTPKDKHMKNDFIEYIDKEGIWNSHLI